LYEAEESSEISSGFSEQGASLMQKGMQPGPGKNSDVYTQ